MLCQTRDRQGEGIERGTCPPLCCNRARRTVRHPTGEGGKGQASRQPRQVQRAFVAVPGVWRAVRVAGRSPALPDCTQSQGGRRASVWYRRLPGSGEGHVALPVASKALRSLPQRTPSSALPSFQDWYVRLVRSQCWTRSDSALLEGAELVDRLPPEDMGAFMTNPVRWECGALGAPHLSRVAYACRFLLSLRNLRRVCAAHTAVLVAGTPVQAAQGIVQSHDSPGGKLCLIQLFMHVKKIDSLVTVLIARSRGPEERCWNVPENVI